MAQFNASVQGTHQSLLSAYAQVDSSQDVATGRQQSAPENVSLDDPHKIAQEIIDMLKGMAASLDGPLTNIQEMIDSAKAESVRLEEALTQQPANHSFEEDSFRSEVNTPGYLSDPRAPAKSVVGIDPEFDEEVQEIVKKTQTVIEEMLNHPSQH